MDRGHVRAQGLYWLVCLAVAAAAGAVLWHADLINPYNNIVLGGITNSLGSAGIEPAEFGGWNYVPEDQGHLGYPTIIKTLLLATGLEPGALASLPVGAVLVALSFYILTVRVSGSQSLGLLAAVAISIDPSLLPGHFSIFAYAWARTLFLIGVLLLLNPKRLVSDPRLGSVFLIIYLGSFSLYWTSTVILAILVGLVSLMWWIFNGDERKTHRGLLSLFAFTSVIYVGFSQILYRSYLPELVGQEDTPFLLGVQEMFGWFGGEAAGPSPQYQAVGSHLPLFDNLLIGRYLLVLVPVTIFLFWAFSRYPSDRRLGAPDRPKIVAALAIAGLVQSFAYAAQGHFSARYLFLAGLISLPYCGRAIFGEKRTAAYLLLLLLVSGGALGLNVGTGLDNYNHSVATDQSGASFILSQTDEDVESLYDLKTFSNHFVVAQELNENRGALFLNPERYSHLVEGRHTELAADFVVINLHRADGNTLSPGWSRMQPLDGYLEDIDDSPGANLVYSDSSERIYKLG